MHYTGMAAMRGPVELSYDPLWVALSVIVAIGAATAALWLAFGTKDPGQKLAAAIVLGFAISGMHYTGMRAAICTAPATTEVAQEVTTLDRTPLAVAIAGFVLADLAALFASVLQAQARRRGPASDAGGSCPHPTGHRHGRAGGLDYT